MPKAKKKTTREKALKKAAQLDALLDEDGKLGKQLRSIFSMFREWHAEQHNKVSFNTYDEWSFQGPMVCVEKIEQAIRDARRELGGSSVDWCSNNNYKE